MTNKIHSYTSLYRQNNNMQNDRHALYYLFKFVNKLFIINYKLLTDKVNN